jgi:hypothetical protein
MFLAVDFAMPAGLKRYYGKGHVRFITLSCYRRLPLLKTARARYIFEALGEIPVRGNRYSSGWNMVFVLDNCCSAPQLLSRLGVNL